MHTLEPLCNLEQSTLLKELGLAEKVFNYYLNRFVYNPITVNPNKWSELEGNYSNHNIHGDAYISRPTISMARNWVWEKYKLWIETTYMPENQSYYARIWTELPLPFTGINDSPIEAESECLTEILKHLKNKSND